MELSEKKTAEKAQQKKTYTPPLLEGEPTTTTTKNPTFIMSVPEANWNFGDNKPSFNKETYADTTRKIKDIRNETKDQTKKKKETQEERKKRLFTIYNLASDQPSETVIMEAVSERFNRKVDEILEVVARDTRFRARYNILFYHEADCSYLKRNGITIAGQRIKGSNDRPRRPQQQVIRIFIPNFPVYGPEEELFDLIHEFGVIQFLRQRKHSKYNVHIGGWVGAIVLKENCRIPDSITFNDEEFDIVYPGKPRKEKTLEKTTKKNKTRT